MSRRSIGYAESGVNWGNNVKKTDPMKSIHSSFQVFKSRDPFGSKSISTIYQNKMKQLALLE